MSNQSPTDREPTVRNCGHKPLEAFVVVRHVTGGSGAAQIFNRLRDNSPAEGMPALLPGDLLTVSSGKYTSTPERPFRGVTAQIDYVQVEIRQQMNIVSSTSRPTEAEANWMAHLLARWRLEDGRTSGCSGQPARVQENEISEPAVGGQSRRKS